MKFMLPLFAALSTLTMTAAPAMAAPTVDATMTCTGKGLGCSSSSAALGTGTEFTGNFIGMPILGFDFSDGLLKISNVNAYAYGVVGDMTMTFRNQLDPFTAVSFVSSSGFSHLSPTDFTVTDGALNFSSRFFSAAQNASMTLRIDSAAAVPEPASWAMMVVGVGLMGMALRRRPRSAVVAV